MSAFPSTSTRRRTGTALGALLLAGTLVTAGAAPSYAAPTRHEGPLTIAMGEWCDLGYQAATAGSVAGLIYDDADRPEAGEVFYAYVEVAATAEPCIEQHMLPDIVLPSGVRLAVSESHPIRCVRWDYSTGGAVEHPERTLCPSQPSPGVSGGHWSFPTAQGDLWRLPYQTGYEVQVPVVSTEPGPVTVRFASQLIDGVTDPVLRTTSPELRVGGAPATVDARVAGTVRLSRTGGDVPVKVTARPAGAAVKVVLSVRRNGRWVVVADRSATASASRQELAIAVPRAARRALPRAGAPARVVTTVRSGGQQGRDSDQLTLKR